MFGRPIKHVTVDEIPRVTQELSLICRLCGHGATYNVGTIFYEPAGDGAFAQPRHFFTNYFRCLACDGAGPWDFVEPAKLMELAARRGRDPGYDGLHEGRCHLFDGTSHQSPALGEQHLLRLLQLDPGSAFLRTRLGNLLRGAGLAAKAGEWYERALALYPGDIEARFHLFSFAVQAADIPATLTHAPLLARHLLEGRKTNFDDLTRVIAYYLVDQLRAAPDQFRDLFLSAAQEGADHKEVIFIRTLLAMDGDEDWIADDATERLLQGIPAPADQPEPDCTTSLRLVPSLQALVEHETLDPTRLTVALLTGESGRIQVDDRHAVPVTNGKAGVVWAAPSLQELFRGSGTPPADMDHYPPEFDPMFFLIESHFLSLCSARGNLTDQQTEEIYSMLRRRPDGRSLGVEHDFVWQVAALMLGSYEMSAAEFEALFRQLAKSARVRSQFPVSRNYAAYLRSSLE